MRQLACVPGLLTFHDKNRAPLQDACLFFFLDSSKGLVQGECAWRGNSPGASHRSPRSSHQNISPLSSWPVILDDKEEALLLIAWLLSGLMQGLGAG